MGLDITAYRDLEKVDNPVLDQDGYPQADGQWRSHRASVSERNFPGRAAGVDPDAIYAFSESMRFRAGSYGWYNQWRAELATFAGYKSAAAIWDKPPPGAPFVELINFTDCEGVIGPVVAAKLAKDFADHRQAAAKIGGDFFNLYCSWQQAFDMAGCNGAVEFH